MTTPTDKAQALAAGACDACKVRGLNRTHTCRAFLSGFRARDEEVEKLKAEVERLRAVADAARNVLHALQWVGNKTLTDLHQALSALDPKAGDDTLKG